VGVDSHREVEGLRLAFLAFGHAADKRAQSGSLYYMAQALQPYFEHIHCCEPITSLEKQAARVIDGVSRRLLKRRIAYDHLSLVATKHARIAAQQLEGRCVDALLAIMNPVDVAYLQTKMPIILVLDATFARQKDYYPQFTNLWGWSIRQAHNVEQVAYHNAAALVYASDWAAQSAMRDYGAEHEKVHIIPYGANLEAVPPEKVVMAKKPSKRCRLLFLGTPWEEKGGAIAFGTLMALEEIGIKAELVICGATPPRGLSHERMIVVPFLDKSDELQNRRLHSLFETSDFLLLPTRREAYGHVFCEASAFGLPSITRNTGAVPEVVRDGENGHVLPYGAKAREYAQVIADLYRDTERYRRLVAASRGAYERRMNWDVWAKRIREVVEGLA
jgi:glycosyltransferase involved in cell wall biosynthesis